MGHADHHRQASGTVESVTVALVTVSDSRTPETDRSGPLMARLLTAAGHRVAFHELVPNRAEAVAQVLARGLRAADAVFFSGGTGLSRRDKTVDTVKERFEREVPGFGELFRHLSYREMGPAALLSRACAGSVEGKLVVCLPGSPAGVELALRELLLPELRHLVWDLRR